MYKGNTGLSPQIQERILNTFQQTLSLAQEGNRQEALLGCDFILRLDPLFEPARRLQDDLSKGDGFIDVHDYQEFGHAAGGELEPPPGEAEVKPPDDVELEPPPDEAVLAPVDAVPPTDETPSDDVAGQIAMLFEQRSFQQLLQLAQEHQERIVADAALRQLVETATARLEAEPYVRNFLESARTAKDLGDVDSARSHLAKARDLDPSHPDIAGLEADLSTAGVTDTPLEPEEPASIAEDLLADEPLELAPESIPSLDGQPAARLDSESEQRIDALLGEGQEAFEAGQFQSAIDAWSRIFLIDIDHAEAGRRIELARKLKAEVERQVEEAFHEALSQLESGEIDDARSTLKKVLEMQPNHVGAREYLQKLDAGSIGASPVEPVDTAPPAVPQVPAEGVEDMLEAEELDTEFPEEAYPVPEPAGEAVIEEPAPAPRRKSFAIIGSAVLVVVVLIAWFAFSNWDRIFPPSATQQTETPTPRLDPIERARELHEAGNTAMAINVLRRLPPSHQQYAEGQSMIAMWEAGDPSVAPETGALTSEQDLAQRAALIAEARRATERGENLLALDLLDQAAVITRLDEEEREIQIVASDMLEDFRQELDLFEQGDWEYALPNLWRAHEADPQNRDVVRLMVDSYYNLGLRDLQRGDSKSALEKFEEALELYPEDLEVLRLAEFATSYTQRSSDLLYRIFVKYQHFR